ncbi:MAG: Rrf2 family transcriptional regulator [Candidatus Zixiibacteriota bacterium]
MQFTKAEEYGMFGVLYLAEKDRSVITPLSEISEAQNIPEKFLAKIFQSLSKNGIVRSHRGVRGGFTLAKDPREITLKEVLETIQGPYHLMKCIKDIRNCDNNGQGFCALREVILIAEEQLCAVFEKYTIADLIEWQRRKEIVR